MDFESSLCLAVKCQNRFAVSPDLNFEIIHKLKPLFFYVFGEKLKCMGIYYKIQHKVLALSKLEKNTTKSKQTTAIHNNPTCLPCLSVYHLNIPSTPLQIMEFINRIDNPCSYEIIKAVRLRQMHNISHISFLY